MTTSSTYGGMQARIADEVLGAVTTAHIQNAIQDAIGKYERRRFYFNEVRDGQGILQTESGPSLLTSAGLPLLDSTTFETETGQEFYNEWDYPILGGMAAIDKMTVLYANNRYPLRRRTPQWFEDNSFSTTWQGLPTDWCWIGGTVRLYPVPNGVYPVFISGTQRLPALVNPGDVNAWTCDAEELIRLCACGILYRRIVRDPAMAQVMALDEAQALAALETETAQRAVGEGRIRPHGFW